MRSLPLRPNIEQIRKQAKDLIRAHREYDRASCDTLRWLPRFAEADEPSILAAAVTLTEAQQALAMDYGFRDWPSLGRAVEELAGQRNAGDLVIPRPLLQRWQAAVDILAAAIAVPVALVMRIREEDIEVFLASSSRGNPYEPGQRERLLGSGLYCEAVIRSRARLLVPHAPSDPAWADNPDIALDMVSYLGFPLELPTGEVFGTICVLDREGNHYSEQSLRLMDNMRALIEAQLEVLDSNRQMSIRVGQLEDSLKEVRSLRELLPICMYCKSIRTEEGTWISIEQHLARTVGTQTSHGICPTCVADKDHEWR